ncbi:MAG TPA: hypothetical protein VFZ53_04350 [Polyangiaceae bacterium]
MATLKDFGFAPEDPSSRSTRRRRYDDESGARPLPRGAYEREVYAVDPLYDDPLDEEVELPGVSKERAGLYFGIGVGLGITVLAVAGGLYLGGYAGRAELGPAPEAPPLAAGGPLDDMLNEEALARARIAPVWISEASVRPTAAEKESTDIQVVEESSPAEATPPVTDAPAQSSRASSTRRAVSSEQMSGEEMDMDAGVPSAPKSEPKELSNELDRLQDSLTPRGPAAPKAPTNDPSAPEMPLPPPAAPTAPAETTPPASQ